MTQETELQMEAQAEIYADARYDHRDPDERIQWHERYEDFKAGAQTILENPGEWGLVKYEAYEHITKEWLTSKAENKRYREALERIAAIAAERDRYREALESVDEDLVFLEDCAHHAEGDIATIARKKIEEALKQEE